MQFNRIGAERIRQIKLPRIGIQKQTDVDAHAVQLLHCRGDSLPMSDHVETTFRGNLFALFRHKRRLIGFPATSNGENFSRAGQFQIQLHADRLPEQFQIAILNVPAVFPQMNGDAIGPAQLGDGSSPDRIGLISPPCLPQCSDVIDVDAEFGH